MPAATGPTGSDGRSLVNAVTALRAAKRAVHVTFVELRRTLSSTEQRILRCLEEGGATRSQLESLIEHRFHIADDVQLGRAEGKVRYSIDSNLNALRKVMGEDFDRVPVSPPVAQLPLTQPPAVPIENTIITAARKALIESDDAYSAAVSACMAELTAEVVHLDSAIAALLSKGAGGLRDSFRIDLISGLYFIIKDVEGRWFQAKQELRAAYVAAMEAELGEAAPGLRSELPRRGPYMPIDPAPHDEEAKRRHLSRRSEPDTATTYIPAWGDESVERGLPEYIHDSNPAVATSVANAVSIEVQEACATVLATTAGQVRAALVPLYLVDATAPDDPIEDLINASAVRGAFQLGELLADRLSRAVSRRFAID